MSWRRAERVLRSLWKPPRRVPVLYDRSEQPRLLPGEPESIVINAHYEAGLGWHLGIVIRRQFQEWADASSGTYELLSTPELVSVIEATLCLELRV
jgi:hypothetical protein